MDIFNETEYEYMFLYRKNKNIEYPIRHGFECDRGWDNLIVELIKKIKEVDINKSVRIVQIKNKFAGLRFYIDFINDMGKTDADTKQKIYDLIEQYEFKSFSVCEVCGKEGKPRPELKYKQTLCDDHFNQKR